MFSDDELKKMGIGKGYTFLSYVIIFGGILLVLFLIVAFIHDAWTGQLPGGGGGGNYECSFSELTGEYYCPDPPDQWQDDFPARP